MKLDGPDFYRTKILGYTGDENGVGKVWSLAVDPMRGWVFIIERYRFLRWTWSWEKVKFAPFSSKGFGVWGLRFGVLGFGVYNRLEKGANLTPAWSWMCYMISSRVVGRHTVRWSLAVGIQDWKVRFWGLLPTQWLWRHLYTVAFW